MGDFALAGIEMLGCERVEDGAVSAIDDHENDVGLLASAVLTIQALSLVAARRSF